MLLWHGFGSYTPHPDYKLLDALIGKRLRVRGFRGNRASRKCIFASTVRQQALDYAKDESPEFLRIAVPQAGSVLTWCEGAGDVLLNFCSHYRDRFWRRDFVAKGVSCRSLMLDTQGDAGTLELYLSVGRQKPAISRLIDEYLDERPFREEVVAKGSGLEACLGRHVGEVWITGPVDLKEEHSFAPA